MVVARIHLWEIIMSRPIFIVSDLHAGIGDARDNFAWMSNGWRATEFNNFLDYVEAENGELIINGDLLEMWQNNVSKVITYRRPLLDRLASMQATYLIGNHDLDILHFNPSNDIVLDHPLFADVKLSCTVQICGRKTLILHGHLQDKYCCNESPDLGRISAVYSGLREDKNGSPISRFKFGSKTVEARSLGHWGRFTACCRRLVGQPSLDMLIRQEIFKTYEEQKVDALIFGHTHEPGVFVNDGQKLPIYNCGTWAETVNTFACINEDTGMVSLFNWIRDGFDCNTDELRLKCEN